MKRLQVLRACVLLDEGMPITAVAYRAGFGTRTSFFRVFRRITGTTPGAYRKRKQLQRR
jgi:two-component system response regulator YesN